MAGGRSGATGISKGAAAPFGVKSASAPALRSPFAGEDVLHGYLEQVAAGRAGQRAIIFRLSRLDRSHRRDKHLQIVGNMLQEVTQEYPGRLFVLRSGDVVMICKGITRKAIDETTELLRYLFNDDPLAREGAEAADFCATFDLEINHAQFLAALEEIREAEASAAPSRRCRRGSCSAARPDRSIPSAPASSSMP